MTQCKSNFQYRISKISNKQGNICRSWSKPVSNAMARVYPCSCSYKIVHEIKFDEPIRGHHVFQKTCTSQKDDFSQHRKRTTVHQDSDRLSLFCIFCMFAGFQLNINTLLQV